MDSAIAAGIMIDARATYDCPREGLAPTEQCSSVEQTLHCDLSTIEDEGGGAEDIASGGGISTERGALACGVPDLLSSSMIEQVAGVDELVSRTRPLRTEIQGRLLCVTLEEAEHRDSICVPVGCRVLAARPEHG